MMMAATIVICSLTYAQTTMVRAERELFASINQARRANGLPALRWNEALGTAARRHAGIMAEHGSAQHGFPGEPNRWALVWVGVKKYNPGIIPRVDSRAVYEIPATSREHTRQRNGFGWNRCRRARPAVLRSGRLFTGEIKVES